jgi:DNA replication protein DnaC
MTGLTEQAAEAAIGSAARALRLPTVRDEAGRIAAQAARDHLTHQAYLAEVLTAEVDERDGRRRARRVAEARFPRVKRLAEFDCSANPNINPATLATLAAGAFIDTGDPLCLIGNSGTGKSHLLIGTGIAACEAGRRVRYVTCAALVNELAEAADERVLSRTVGRYGRLELLCLDLCRHGDYADRGEAMIDAA